MNTGRTCRNCGTPLDEATASGGLCAVCLLRSGLVSDPALETAEPHRLALPHAFGPYELLEEIGRGGMGVVYAARQPALNRTVAVKLLLSGAYASGSAMQRFRTEAAAAAALQHPNIVAIHDYGEWEGQPYYAMDLVAGRNLAELCAGRPLPARRAAEFLRLLAGAVHYAHQHGILHRDLKPSNVLVDEADRPRITDFGLAKMLGSTEGATLTGQMLGSPSYAATEQVAGGGAEINAASDVYGLGALFYHLVTGRAPFNAATPAETVRLVLDTDPAPPRLLNPGLPRDLETICLKCLEKDPGRRYASAAEVAEDVERFIAERPIRARPPGAIYRMGKFARRHRAGVAGVGAVIAALSIGLLVALAQYHRAVQQRHAADAARGQAEGLVGLVAHDLTPMTEQRGGLRQMLKTTEAAVRYYEALPPESRNTTTDRGYAEALYALAYLRARSLNDPQGAAVYSKKALALREKIARANPDDPDAAAAWLESDLYHPGLSGDRATAFSEARYESMVRRARELHARFPNHPQVSALAALVLCSYAYDAQTIYFKPSEAKIALAEGQTIAEQLLAGRFKDQLPSKAVIGDMAYILADALRVAVELGSAEAVAEQALAYFTEALKDDPGNLSYRYHLAMAAVQLSGHGSTPEKGRYGARIAREQGEVLNQLDPENRLFRWVRIWALSLEYWDCYDHAPDFEAVHKIDRERSALGAPHGLDWACSRLWLADLDATAGKTVEARQEIERTQAAFDEYCTTLTGNPSFRCNARVKYLSSKAYALKELRDWPALAGTAQDCLTEIEDGLKRKPGNGPLLCRQADARVFLAIAAQHEGRPAEAIDRLPPLIKFIRGAPPRDYFIDGGGMRGNAEKALVEAWVQLGDRKQARPVAEQMLEQMQPVDARYLSFLTIQDMQAGGLTLTASLCNPAEAVRCIGLADRAKSMLTNPAAIGRLTVDGKENLATLARLRAEAAANLSPEALERAGRELDAATSTDPAASEPFTRAGEVTWNLLPFSSAIASPDAREAELAAREIYRTLVARYPENKAYRFLFAETHRMDGYVHLGWDGQIEPARAAFRQHDALLEPFAGRTGYDSVLRTRLENSLRLAQLAASVGDKTDSARWLEEARKRFESYRDHLPEGSPERGLAHVRFLEESARSAWWLRDWPELARLARAAQAECEAALKQQPEDEELPKHRAVADGFAAVALAGAGQNAGAATRLQEVNDRLKTLLSASGFWDADTIAWATDIALTEALRKNGDLANAKKQARNARHACESWVLIFPEYWRAQKHLAILRVQEAGFLDPAIPFEAARQKELLDLAAAALAPDKVAGRLTVDVQEALREIERLRPATGPRIP